MRKGILLIELLIGLTISGIILLLSQGLLEYCIKSYEGAYNQGDMERARYVADYIAREASQAVAVLPIDGLVKATDQKNYLGFVIVKYDKGSTGNLQGTSILGFTNSKNKIIDENEYLTYSVYFLDNNTIRRNAKTIKRTSGLDDVSSFEGYNALADNIASFDGTYYDSNLNLLRLRITPLIGGKECKEKEVSLDLYLKGEGMSQKPQY